MYKAIAALEAREANGRCLTTSSLRRHEIVFKALLDGLSRAAEVPEPRSSLISVKQKPAANFSSHCRYGLPITTDMFWFPTFSLRANLLTSCSGRANKAGYFCGLDIRESKKSASVCVFSQRGSS